MADIEDLLISQLGCCKHNPASRVGPTPSPTCHTEQGGSRKGMRPLRQRNGSYEIVNPPRETGGGFFIWSGAPTRSGDLVPACQPVQIAELAKSETCMTATIVRLLPADEQALLTCYVKGTSEPDDFGALYDALEVPADATPPRLAIAVAQILLHHIQGTL